MEKYFFIDPDGSKRGPYSVHELVARERLGPDTPIETDSGDIIVAAQIPGLDFGSHSIDSDFGFTEFVTPALITIIWWLTVITTIGTCLYVMYQISSAPLPAEGKGIGALVTIVIAVLCLLYSRIGLELIAIQFRMERHQRTIKENLERNEKAAKP